MMAATNTTTTLGNTMSARAGVPEAKSVTNLLGDLDHDLRSGRAAGFTPIPIGFDAFDEATGGGLRRGDLTVFSGPPGVGKTILGLQMARHLAATGRPAIMVCYEHDQMAMVLRLLAQETSHTDPGGRLISNLSARLRDGARSRTGLAEIVREEPALERALDDLTAIGDYLVLMGASARDTDLAELDALVARTVTRARRRPVLIVDYLQKIPSEDSDAIARSRRAVEGLKDMAMHHDIPIVAMASLTSVGLEARKLRLSHLDDTSAIAFEADVVVLLNDKMDAVAKAHLSYGGDVSKDFPNWVVWGVAKNRSGPNLVNLEFRKDFTHFRFHPEGRHVSERLADDRFEGDAG